MNVKMTDINIKENEDGSFTYSAGGKRITTFPCPCDPTVEAKLRLPLSIGVGWDGPTQMFCKVCRREAKGSTIDDAAANWNKAHKAN